MSAARIFTGPGNFNDPTKWDGGTLPNAGDQCDISTGACSVTTDDSNVYGTLIIRTDAVFDQDGFSMSFGLVTVTGTWKGGLSTGSGMICTGIRFITGSSRDWNTGFKVFNGGKYDCTNVNYSTRVGGSYTQTSNTTIFNNIPINDNVNFYSFTLPANITIRLNGDTHISSESSFLTSIGGIINQFGNDVTIGSSSRGSIILGENADFLGAAGGNNLFLKILNGATVVNNHIGPFTLAGNYQVSPSLTLNSYVLPAWDYSNGAFLQVNSSAAVSTIVTYPGTIVAPNFYLTSTTTNRNYTIDNSVYNPNFNFTEDVDFKHDTRTGVYSWKAGSGTISLSVVTSNISFNSKSVESISVNCATFGGIVTPSKIFTSPGICKSITIVQGAVDFSTQSFTVTDSITVMTAIIRGGNSSSSGIYCSGLYLNVSSSRDWSSNFKISNIGNFLIHSSSRSTGSQSGIISFSGAGNTQYFDPTNHSFNIISVDKNGGILYLKSDCFTNILQGTGGSLYSDVWGVQRIINCKKRGGVCTFMIFRDINAGSLNMVNALTRCYNFGNVKGVVFRSNLK